MDHGLLLLEFNDCLFNDAMRLEKSVIIHKLEKDCEVVVTYCMVPIQHFPEWAVKNYTRNIKMVHLLPRLRLKMGTLSSL